MLHPVIYCTEKNTGEEKKSQGEGVEDKISGDRSHVFSEQEISELFISFVDGNILTSQVIFFFTYIFHFVWELMQLRSISVACDKPLELSRPAEEDA